MKKVTMLVLLAILVSTLIAAIPTPIVRLTMINKSGFDVYMKLEGSGITEAFYYLTVPSGTRDEPTVKVFTVMKDFYKRTTWQCNGLKSSGTIAVSSNIRLDFTPCGEKVCSWTRVWTNGHPLWRDPCTNAAYDGHDWAWAIYHAKAGEPTMEKVTYWKWTQVAYFGQYKGILWPWMPKFRAGLLAKNNMYLVNGYFKWGCNFWAYRIRTYKLPVGCAWAYQY